MLLQQVERAEELLGEATDELQGETAELVGLDELVKIHIQELGRDAEVATEIETVGEVDHAVLVLRILNVAKMKKKKKGVVRGNSTDQGRPGSPGKSR